MPERWRAAVEWVAALAELPMLGHLMQGGGSQRWMADDPVLSGFIGGDGLAAIESAERADYDNGLAGWLRRWRRLWPADDADNAALEELVATIQSHGIHREGSAGPDWRDNLERRALRILRRQREQPVTVFCHLLLLALELHRLREGLLRRALFNDVDAEAAA